MAISGQHPASPHREEPPHGGVSNGETRSASAPQDEVNLSLPSKITLILRRPRSGRLEGRSIVQQGVAGA